MKTVEQQKNLLRIARTYCGHDVTTAIRQRVDDSEDLETMVRIVNTTYEDDAWAMYSGADTMVREWLMDIIEKTYYGDKPLPAPEAEPEKRSVTLTEEEWTDLTTYILMTTKTRLDEAEAWEKLAAEKCPDGSPPLPESRRQRPVLAGDVRQAGAHQEANRPVKTAAGLTA